MGIILGLDIGIASVGVAVLDKEKNEVLCVVSDLFEAADAEKNVERRGFRQARRLKRRQQTRIGDFKKLWTSLGLVIPSEVGNETLKLRVKSLSHEISLVELYSVLLNNLKHRGISYMDEAEDEKTNGSSEYAKGIAINQKELQEKLPCQIQLERLEMYGAYRGNNSVIIDGEKVTLSKVFTMDAYRKEVNTILEKQRKFHSELSQEFIDGYLKIFNRKRAYYEGPGSEKSRTDYGRFTTEKDENGNFITDENIFAKLIGKCSVYTDEYRAAAASYTAQEFNLLNDLNNISIGGRKLEEDEKVKIINEIKESKSLGADRIEKIIAQTSGEDKDTIEGARIDKDDKHIYHSFEMYRKMRDALNEINIDINEYSRDELDEIGRILTINTEKDAMYSEFNKSRIVSISKEVQDCLIIVRKKNSSLFSKWHSLSLKIMNELIPELYSCSCNQMELLTKMGVFKTNTEKFKDLKYLPENIFDNVIYNPVVVRSVRITVRAINAVIKKYGYPEMVVVEMPRDKNSKEESTRIKNEQANNEKELKSIINKIKNEYGITIIDEHFRGHKELRLKLKLWNEQGGICPYSGKTIDINDLLKNQNQFEIDHIIPLSISLDDSRNNKVLVYATENQNKGNKTPFGYLTSVNRVYGWKEYEATILSMKKAKMINSKKTENFLFNKDITKQDVVKGFINRNLNDTRYASRTVLNTLQSFFAAKETGTKVSVIRGSFTSQMRKNLKLDKERDKSYAHHAVDALLIAYSKMGYDAYKKIQGEFIDFETGEILNSQMYEQNMTADAYKNYLYGIRWIEIRRNITDAEKKVKYWHKVDKKCNRSLCNQTIYGTREYDGKVYQISKIKDIHTKEGYEKFKNLINKGEEKKLLCYENDIATFNILKQICEKYSDATNPFVQYEKETGDFVRKYAKDGNGPKIVSLKYRDGEINSCLDISHKYGFEKGSRKVVQGSLDPYRMDVYFNNKDKKYYLIGIKYAHIKSVKNGYEIDRDAYTEVLRAEKLISVSQTMDDLKEFGYEYRLSFYKNEIIQYEKNGIMYTERFLSRTMPAVRNYIETKPIDAKGFMDKKGKNKQNLIGLSSTKTIKKIKTDLLGNQYVCTNEAFSLECH